MNTFREQCPHCGATATLGRSSFADLAWRISHEDGACVFKPDHVPDAGKMVRPCMTCHGTGVVEAACPECSKDVEQ